MKFSKLEIGDTLIIPDINIQVDLLHKTGPTQAKELLVLGGLRMLSEPFHIEPNQEVQRVHCWK